MVLASIATIIQFIWITGCMFSVVYGILFFFKLDTRKSTLEYEQTQLLQVIAALLFTLCGFAGIITYILIYAHTPLRWFM